MPNPENLKTKDNYITNMTTEQRRESGRKGGIKSGESRRRKRQMRELLEILMDVPIKKGKKAEIEKIKNLAIVNDLNLTTEQAILLAMINRAMNGDVNAFTAIRDTLGEKPTDKVESVNEVVVIKDDI